MYAYKRNGEFENLNNDLNLAGPRYQSDIKKFKSKISNDQSEIKINMNEGEEKIADQA